MRLDDVMSALRGLGKREWVRPVVGWASVGPTLFSAEDGLQWAGLGTRLGDLVWPHDLRVTFHLEWGDVVDSDWLLSLGLQRVQVVNVVGCFGVRPVAAIGGIAVWSDFFDSAADEFQAELGEADSFELASGAQRWEGNQPPDAVLPQALYAP